MLNSVHSKTMLFGILSLCSSRMVVSQAPEPPFQATIEVDCDQWLDEQRESVGLIGDVFTFDLVIKNFRKPRILFLKVTAEEEKPYFYRIPNGYQILEITDLKDTAYSAKESSKARIKIKLLSESPQAIRVALFERIGNSGVGLCSNWICFNLADWVERARAMGRRAPAVKIERKSEPTQREKVALPIRK